MLSMKSETFESGDYEESLPKFPFESQHNELISSD